VIKYGNGKNKGQWVKKIHQTLKISELKIYVFSLTRSDKHTHKNAA
jgi:hypothetical protein